MIRKEFAMEAVRLPFSQFPPDVVQNIRAFASDKMPKHPVAKIWVGKVSRGEFSTSVQFIEQVMWHWKEKHGRKLYWIGLGILHNGGVKTSKYRINSV